MQRNFWSFFFITWGCVALAYATVIYCRYDGGSMPLSPAVGGMALLAGIVFRSGRRGPSRKRLHTLSGSITTFSRSRGTR